MYGNVLNAAAIAIAAEGVTVTTVAGATVKYESTAALSKLDYAQGNVAYLSDLTPQIDAAGTAGRREETEPDRGRAGPVARERGDQAGQRRLPEGAVRGAGHRADLRTLNGDYVQFKATIGIDENGANATSSAKVTIEADGQILFSETVKRKDKAKGVVLAVKGVKQLRVIVEADTPFNGNYVTLAEARVQK